MLSSSFAFGCGLVPGCRFNFSGNPTELTATRVRELEIDGLNKFTIRRLKQDTKDWQGQPLYKNHYGMSCADEAEATAVQTAMAYKTAQG
jgi:hypothetical protein